MNLDAANHVEVTDCSATNQSPIKPAQGPTTHLDDAPWMREALIEADLAAAEGEMPVGCVIVKDGRIVARAHNGCERLRDATAHAELLAIRAASRALGDWRLSECTLYCTLEPCPMCAGAIVQARVGRLVYGAADPGQGCAGSVYRICEDPAFPHVCPADGGMLAEACAGRLDAFFARLRQK